MVFLIIFGTRGVTSSRGRGEFFCPSCRARRAYERKRVRRFATLYFLPLIPLGVAGEYVECEVCRATFKPTVLTADERTAGSIEAEFHGAVRRVMVLMMMADGKADPEEIETIRLVFGKLAEREVSPEEVDAEVEAMRSDGRGLRAYLSSVTGTLNDTGKEIVLKAAFFVAAADGVVTEEETALLRELASALEMSPKDFRGTIDRLVAEVGKGAILGRDPM